MKKTFVNDKPSLIGFTEKKGKADRLINPGATFEADEEDIPKVWIELGYVRVVGDAPVASAASADAATMREARVDTPADAKGKSKSAKSTEE